MNTIKVIITGATGMVGEGVLVECIQNKLVDEILLVSRKPYNIAHPKVKELIIANFNDISPEAKQQLTGYDACYYCAGVSSIGMNEADYTYITYTTTLHFAKAYLQQNPDSVFTFVSGKSTDSSEKGKLMWARVKGKTENDLMKLGFKGQYNFRPAFMKHFKEQKNVKPIFKFFAWFFPTLFPSVSLTLHQVGKAMINVTIYGYNKQVLEVSDIKAIANS